MDNTKKSEIKQFLFISILPILGITMMFSYAFLYVKKEITFVKHEIVGLNKIYKIQDIIFTLQKVRGLSAMKCKDDKCLGDLDKFIVEIKDKVNNLKEEILDAPSSMHREKDFVLFFDSLIHHLNDGNNFEHISETIRESKLLTENISYHSNLVLDSDLGSSILSTILVNILPSLIEYNGKIRGISSSITNGKISIFQKRKILIIQSKIIDNLKRLEFTMKELSHKLELNVIEKIYKNTILAQNELLSFVTNEILNKNEIKLDSNTIFNLETNNIEFILLLYTENYKELSDILNSRLEEKKKLSYYILITAFISVFFILFVNIFFNKRNKKYIETIKILSITDGMTKLYNRRYFDSEFTRLLKLQKRTNSNLIFIMMDIDHFKQYNDTYGHQDGDDALIAVSNSLKKSLNRPDDFAFRLGGEEFGILCSNMNKQQSMLFANKLRLNILNLKIEHKNNSASDYLTISMGVVMIEKDNNLSEDELYKNADSALYNAKNNGRNQVSTDNKST